MDSLSSEPVGLYLTSYLWIYLIVRWVNRVLNPDNMVIMSLAVGVAVLIENILLLIVFFKNLPFIEYAIQVVLSQMLWAVITGSFIFKSIDFVFKRWETIVFQLYGNENNSPL